MNGAYLISGVLVVAILLAWYDHSRQGRNDWKRR